MLGALGILIISFSKLDEKWCRVLIYKVSITLNY